MVGRTKASSFKALGSLHDGEPIMNLPPKTTRLIKVDFSTEDRAFYDKLEADSRSQFEAYAAAGTVHQNYEYILLMLLQLRKACDHPLLVKGFNSDAVSRVSGRMAKRLPRDFLINLLKHFETSLAICHVCSEEKKKMVASAFGEGPCGSSATRLTAEDLIFSWDSSPKE